MCGLKILKTLLKEIQQPSHVFMRLTFEPFLLESLNFAIRRFSCAESADAKISEMQILNALIFECLDLLSRFLKVAFWDIF